MTAPRIVVVDDEIIIARELEARLTNLGYEVAGLAASGEEAIQLVQEIRPDLVLMDVVLKGEMDGIDAAAEIRRTCSLPVIYVTAYTDESTLSRARVTEPFAYIVKPFSERELRANIEMALYKHQVENRLRRVERWFAASMERVGDGVVAADRRGTVNFLNTEAETLTGYSAAEAIGKHLDEVLRFISKSDRTPADNLVQRALGEGIVTYLSDDTLMVDRAGNDHLVDATAVSVRGNNHGGNGIVVVLRDLSERKKVQEALRDSEERFRLLVEGIKDYAIYMLDPEGRVMTWNPGARRVKGYDAEEVIGQHFSRFYPPDAVASGWPDHELQVARQEGRFEDEGWRIRKDGSKFWANVVITPLYDDSRKLRGFAKVTRDLTEQRRTEEEIRRKNEALAQAVRQKDEFLAMLAHELRNPLAPIRNGLHILTLPATDEATAEQARQIMERQVDHLSRLVDDLLDVSRITRGKIELRTETVDLAAAVSRAADTIRPQAEERQQGLTVLLPSQPLLLQADPTRLEQVLVNLLHNAVKYTKPGGHISLTSEPQAGQAVIRVRDDGDGISADLLPRIFDLFTQSARPLDRSSGGLGIGLTMVKKLVELHGGTVEAHSDGPGQGSEFIVRLPALPVSQTEQPASNAHEATKRRSMRVLVVEDVPATAQTFIILVRALGFDVRAVHDGPSALVAYRMYQPDVVLLDIGLPGMNGYEVARGMRQQAGERRPLIMAVTGYGTDDDRRRSREAGIDFHMTKPVDPTALTKLLSGIGQTMPA